MAGSAAGWLAGLPLDLLLSPWALALLGLAVGSFLNVVAHRMPLMLERQWWGDVAAQLMDAASFKRVFGTDAPERLQMVGGTVEKALADATPLTLSKPASRCPHCGHRIRWYENIPVVSWLVLRAKCSACSARKASFARSMASLCCPICRCDASSCSSRLARARTRHARPP